MKRNSKGKTGTKMDTIKLILESACNVFSIYGYEKTTVEMIAETAQLSRQVVYNYFQSKEALLTESLLYHDQIIDEQLLGIVYREEAGYFERLNGLVQTALNYFTQTHKCLYQRLTIEFQGQTNKFTPIIEAHNNKWRQALLYLSTALYGAMAGKKHANETYEEIMGKAMMKTYFAPLVELSDVMHEAM